MVEESCGTAREVRGASVCWKLAVTRSELELPGSVHFVITHQAVYLQSIHFSMCILLQCY